MASYSIGYRPSVSKDFRRLSKDIVLRIRQRIKELSGDPFPQQTVKISDSEGLYRNRVGDYRIVYSVDTENKIITIHHVRHRREVYRSL